MNKNTFRVFLIVMVFAVGGFYVCNGKSKHSPTIELNNKSFGTAQIQNAKKTDNQSNGKKPSHANENRNSPKTSSIIEVLKDTTLSGWKTYTNELYGFSFQYPASWFKSGDDITIGDRSGNVAGIDINFVDTLSPTALLIEYHFGSNGSDVYKYALSQLNSLQGLYKTEGKQIDVAGRKAVEAFTIISINGKGIPLNPQIRLILVDFLDKKQMGTIEMQFRTPMPNNEVEIDKFNQLLASF